MSLHKSGETYLKSIYLLSAEIKDLRAVDVATMMGVTKPSTCRALSLLSRDGYITFNEHKKISLTDSGRKAAKKIIDKQEAVSKLLTIIGVDENTAHDDACRIEYGISDETVKIIKQFIKKVED